MKKILFTTLFSLSFIILNAQNNNNNNNDVKFGVNTLLQSYYNNNIHTPSSFLYGLHLTDKWTIQNKWVNTYATLYLNQFNLGGEGVIPIDTDNSMKIGLIGGHALIYRWNKYPYEYEEEFCIHDESNFKKFDGRTYFGLQVEIWDKVNINTVVQYYIQSKLGVAIELRIYPFNKK